MFFYLGRFTPYCKVDLLKSPSKLYIHISMNTAFYDIPKILLI